MGIFTSLKFFKCFIAWSNKQMFFSNEREKRESARFLKLNVNPQGDNTAAVFGASHVLNFATFPPSVTTETSFFFLKKENEVKEVSKRDLA